jgi:two-component system, OmpR family, phosphate regulon sensor histidine kinase PhoR
MNGERQSDLVEGVKGESDDRKFEQILDRLPHGVLVLDRELVVEYVNPEARRLLGSGSALEPGDPLPELFTGLQTRTLIESLFTTEPDTDGHLVGTKGRTLCVRGLPATDIDGLVVSIEDVTDRERRSEAEKHFIENAAHELRTPLAAIISVIDVLEGGAKDTPDIRDRFLAHLREHSERLRRLATSLLILARIQTGQRAPHVELVHVRPLLTQIAEDLDTASGVETFVRSPLNLATLADEELLHTALANIAENAAKYTSAGRIAFEARQRGNRMEIEVRDTGRGMSREERDHAFDRFYRAETGREGYGLGLAIAEEAIAALDGTMSLDSAPGVGTKVLIELPSAELVS